ncbi:ComF family protein [Massilia terrae]|uniref:ComF family protein n=1 Tax=Massilia terrae TaxID=1811224 RepID=A0ABT2D078_9BURK|nr:ComF family protein [Massilia terrae]MCS0659621.1 ComF family protein [Massilia terrae]
MLEPLRLWWHRWPRALAGALLPSCCALCGEVCGAVVCTDCHAQYVAVRTRCGRCANPLADGETGQCGKCLADPPAFDATIVGADYAAPLDQLVLQLKFGSRLALAPWFAHLLRDAVLARPALALPDVLCPVPLGPRRLVERGFNQALEIARPLGRSIGVPVQARLAVRAVETRAQSGVSPQERRQNMRGAFGVEAEMMAVVEGRHVGVVDDVMTSGSTLDELAATLKQAGAARVTNLVFARTPPR